VLGHPASQARSAIGINFNFVACNTGASLSPLIITAPALNGNASVASFCDGIDRSEWISMRSRPTSTCAANLRRALERGLGTAVPPLLTQYQGRLNSCVNPVLLQSLVLH
jgi:hypothetical protein